MLWSHIISKCEKEQIRQIISENNLNSVTDVYALLWDSFKDILQELMKAELDATLGYGKNRKGDLKTDNKLKLSDELIRFLQNNGGTPPDGAPSVFMFREFGIKSLELELVI